MITIIHQASDAYRTNDLLRSLSANASSKDTYEVVIEINEITDSLIEEYRDKINFCHAIPEGSLLYWPLGNNLVLGSHWDKYLIHWANKEKEGDYVIIPSIAGLDNPVWPHLPSDTLPHTKIYAWQVNCV